METIVHARTYGRKIFVAALSFGLMMPLVTVCQASRAPDLDEFKDHVPGLIVFKQAREVPDAELAGLRGRFVSRGRVIYFGVEMYTKWKTGGGDVYSAKLGLGLNTRIKFRPTVSIWRNASARRGTQPQVATDDSSNRTQGTKKISRGGLNSVRGVGQVIQVTGDTNRISNAISVDVKTHNSGDDTAPAPTANAVTNAGNGPQGSLVTTSIDPNNLTVNVSVPGQGAATQSISNLGGLRQAVQVVGNTNTIVNQMRLDLQLRPQNLIKAVGLRSSLHVLRGLPGLP